MKNKKYELVEYDFILHKGRKLYRIRALKKFETARDGAVHRGDKGGYIEGYHNLSQKGKCWIFYDAKVYDSAKIENDATLGGCVEVYGNAVVKDSAIVGDDTKVYGNAVIEDDARIFGSAEISGNARIEDQARVEGHAEVFGKAILKGRAIVGDYTKVYDNARLEGSIFVYNNAEICGNAVVCGNDMDGIAAVAVKGSAKVLDNASVISNRCAYFIDGGGYICDNVRVYGNNTKSVISFGRKVSNNSVICN